MENKKNAILVGASGLVGSSLLEQLLENPAYSSVLTITRKKLQRQQPKLKQLVINFDELGSHAEEIKGDVVFCALGTTKEQTPDKAQYRKIDYQYPLDIARIACENGASQYHIVSSIGADPSSGIFYLKLKGETERDLQQIPFKSIHIYNPSMLDGDRKEQRTAEGLINGMMHVINPLLIGSLKKYRSIKIEKVASAMIRQSLEDLNGVHFYPSDKIEALSRM